MQYKEYRPAVIMFSDIQGFANMMEQNEESTLKILSFHNDLLRKLISEHGGTVIKTSGDAFLSDFPSAASAVTCALAIQKEIQSYNTSVESEPIYLRIGIHFGEIYFLHDDALGEGISIASRLQSLARPGRICISKEVRDRIIELPNLTIAAIGRTRVKNIAKEIEAYEIIPEGEEISTDTASIDGSEGAEQGPVGEAKTGEKKPKATEEISLKEIGDFILSQVKKVSRRVSIDSLKKKFPSRSAELDRFLDRLVSSGYLTKLEKDDGEVTYGVDDENSWDGYLDEDSYFDYSRKFQKKFERKMSRKYARKVSKQFGRHHKRYGWGGMPAPPFTFGPDMNRHWPGQKLPGTWDEYKEMVIQQAEKASVGFSGHFAVFITVNIAIFVINYLINMEFPFFLIPLAGWGIGFLANVVTLINKKRWKKEVDKLPPLGEEGMRVYHELRLSKNRLSNHLASFLTINSLIILLGTLIGIGFPIVIIPTLLWGIGLVSNIFSFFARTRILKRKLGELTGKIAGRTNGKKNEYEGEDESIRQALELKASILEAIQSFGKGKSPLDVDMKPLLEDYISRLKELSARYKEIEAILLSVPSSDLEKDVVRLQAKIEHTTSPYMKQEYEKSIKEIERHKQSFDELYNQKEIIELRLNSSLNNLKQLKVNLARMKGLGSGEGEASVSLLKDKTRELSEYLDDLREAYREIE